MNIKNKLLLPRKRSPGAATSGRTDYTVYRMSKVEFATYALLYTVLMCMVSILFYNSLIPVILFLPFEMVLMKIKTRELGKKKQKQLLMEFSEMISSLAANLGAGYSLERAFYAAHDDIKNLYAESLIQKELALIVKGIQMNIPVEELLLDFGRRSDMEDIYDFSQIVRVAKRSGGDIVGIIKRTAQKINQKQEVENEIDTMITSKRLEQRIMCIMPFAIVAYLRLTNGTYISGMYGNLPGIIAMTICLIVIAVSGLWGKKIVNIEV